MQELRGVGAWVPALVVAIFMLGCASGETFYIDAINGDDSATGVSQSSAWKTVDRAFQAFSGLAGPTTFFLGSGNYGEFRPTSSDLSARR